MTSKLHRKYWEYTGKVQGKYWEFNQILPGKNLPGKYQGSTIKTTRKHPIYTERSRKILGKTWKNTRTVHGKYWESSAKVQGK